VFVQIKEIQQSAGLWKDYNNVEELACTDLQTQGPVKLDLRLTNAGTRILVQGRVQAQVMVKCARCDESFPLPMDLEVEEYFVPANSPEAADAKGLDALEVLTYQEDRVVLDEMLRQNFLAAVPMQPVCRDGECRGLCGQCGADLNQGPCGCDDEEIDPRLAGLGELAKRKASGPSLN
jgi:uncharacterized protein